MKRHGETLKEYYEVNESNPKRLQPVWFQIYDIVENSKLWDSKRMESSQGLRWRMG